MTLSQQIETLPLRLRQKTMTAMLAAAVILDGLDIKILAYAAPLILAEWSITKASFGYVMAAAAVGMAVGTPIGGWAGDRWGRRVVVILCLLLFGATTLAVSATHDLRLLTALRFIGGLGFGAITPNAYALTTEWLPTQARLKANALLTTGNPIGGMLGALFMMGLLALVGWRGCFVAAGALTLLHALITWRWLPESVAFLLNAGQRDRAEQQWREVTGTTLMVPTESKPESSVSVRHDAQADASPAAPLGSIFADSLRRTSVGAALCYFSIQFISYAVASWGPVIFTSAGLPLSDAMLAGVSFNVLAILVIFIIGPLLRRYSTLQALLTCSALMGVLTAAMAYLLLSGLEHSLLLRIALITDWGLIGGISGALFQLVVVITTAAYPTAIRATGVGFTAAAGRVGGIFAMLGGGLLLTWGHDSPIWFIIALAVLALSITPFALIIRAHQQPVPRPLQPQPALG